LGSLCHRASESCVRIGKYFICMSSIYLFLLSQNCLGEWLCFEHKIHVAVTIGLNLVYYGNGTWLIKLEVQKMSCSLLLEFQVEIGLGLPR
jgi:hypothetical protein